jgi:hypothetical protein
VYQLRAAQNAVGLAHVRMPGFEAPQIPSTCDETESGLPGGPLTSPREDGIVGQEEFCCLLPDLAVTRFSTLP